MSKIIRVFILLIFLSGKSFAQDSALLKFGYKPDKLYKIYTEIISDNTMSFEGDSTRIEEIKAITSNIPPHQIKTQSFEYEIKTDSLQKDSCLAFIMKIKKFEIGLPVETMGYEYKPVKNLEIEGNFFAGNKIDSLIIKKKKITDVLKSMILQNAENTLCKYKFPEKPIKLGESIEQEYKLQLPVGGSALLYLDVKSTFYLDKIENGNLYFNKTTTLNYSQADRRMSVRAQGKGVGYFVYNIKEDFFITDNDDMDFKLEFEQYGLITITKTKSKSQTRCEIL